MQRVKAMPEQDDHCRECINLFSGYRKGYFQALVDVNNLFRALGDKT
jgi:hypothetical protein